VAFIVSSTNLNNDLVLTLSRSTVGRKMIIKLKK
jgi:hypothetical protein